MYGHPVGGSIHECHSLHETATIRPCNIVSSSWPKIKGQFSCFGIFIELT